MDTYSTTSTRTRMATGNESALGEEIAVVSPRRENPSLAHELTTADGTRRWVPSGDPIENWWTELAPDGSALPGEWEYDSDNKTLMRSIG